MNAERDDERILDAAKKQIGREAYQEHMDRATRNLSVDVVNALQVRRSRRQWFLRVSVAATAATAAVVLWMVTPPTRDVVAPTPTPTVTAVAEPAIPDTDSETLATEYLSEVIDEQAIDRIVEVAEVEPTILTDQDIDALLEEM